MGDTKRKKRKNLSKKGIDMMKPVDLSVIGTDNDPCFGKHYDSTAPECTNCGDSEFCLIATANRMNVKRLELEAKNQYKDLEEQALIPLKRKNSKRRKATLFLRSRLKNKEYISRSNAIKLLAKKFKCDSTKAEKLLDRVLVGTRVITEENKKLYFNAKG